MTKDAVLTEGNAKCHVSVGRLFLLLKIGVYLLCATVSVSAGQHSESAIGIHVAPLFLDFLPICWRCSVAKWCPALYDRMNCSTPGFPSSLSP